ncbi:hypothetical protein VTO73DRAFT_14257 [Trametes versicolor]
MISRVHWQQRNTTKTFFPLLATRVWHSDGCGSQRGQSVQPTPSLPCPRIPLPLFTIPLPPTAFHVHIRTAGVQIEINVRPAVAQSRNTSARPGLSSCVPSGPSCAS